MGSEAIIHRRHAVDVAGGILVKRLVERCHSWRWPAHIVDQHGDVQIFEALHYPVDLRGRLRTGSSRVRDGDPEVQVREFFDHLLPHAVEFQFVSSVEDDVEIATSEFAGNGPANPIRSASDESPRLLPVIVAVN